MVEQCLLSGSNRMEHITLGLKSLHWLPVQFRTDINILDAKGWFGGLVSDYLAELLTPDWLVCTLRSSSRSPLVMTWSNLKTNGAFKAVCSALEAQRFTARRSASSRVELYCEGHSENMDELIRKTSLFPKLKPKTDAVCAAQIISRDFTFPQLLFSYYLTFANTL